MNEIRNMVVIGSGNVAWHMINAFQGKGTRIIQVVARNRHSAERIKTEFSVPFILSPERLNLSADLYLLAVQDENILPAARQLGLTDQFLVHTSGFYGLDILSGVSSNTGVIWPLQTLTAGKGVDYLEIPFFIESHQPENESKLRKFASLISGKVIAADSQARQKAHLAAVVASNLTNHLYAISATILERQDLPFEVLGPLIRETAAKAALSHPLEGQTGPAVRKDLKVIEKHLELLRNEPAYRDIYRLISENIIHHHSNKK